jgi:hypothetical protein
VRTDAEDLLGLIIGLTIANGAALDLCITAPGASAMPQYLKALIIVVLLIDVVILLLALYLIIFKFSRRSSSGNDDNGE